MPIVDMLEEPLEVANAPAIPETLQVHKVVREITKENIPLVKFFKLSRDDTPAYTQYYRSEKDPQVCGHPDRDVDDNTALIVSPIKKSITRRKSGSVAHFVKSGFMKVVFINYN